MRRRPMPSIGYNLSGVRCQVPYINCVMSDSIQGLKHRVLASKGGSLAKGFESSDKRLF